MGQRWWSRWPRKNSRPFCSGCGRRGRPYDRLEERRFEFVPIWGILVFLAYRMRRVDCKRCGVTVEMVPWCDGKNQLTTTYRWYLATWAKRLSWSEVGSIFRTSWDSVCRAVEHAVEWGLAHRDLSDVTALGVDEIAWARGHTYLTLVYDIGGKRRDCWPWLRIGVKRACGAAWIVLASRSAWG